MTTTPAPDPESAETSLPGFSAFRFPALGPQAKTVYRIGSGAGVLLLHELPGMVPECIALARELGASGFTVFMPLLFGRPGGGGGLWNLRRVCVRREFNLWKANQDSPVVGWLRGLARHVANLDGCGPRVGAIGMCLTGGLALALVVEPEVVAPVMAQPSLPLTTPLSSRARKRALDLSAETMEHAIRRSKEGLKVLGIRFEHDWICPPARFERLREDLGDAFQTCIVAGRKHSVLTLHRTSMTVADESRSLDTLLSFLRAGLEVPAAPPQPGGEQT